MFPEIKAIVSNKIKCNEKEGICATNNSLLYLKLGLMNFHALELNDLENLRDMNNIKRAQSTKLKNRSSQSMLDNNLTGKLNDFFRLQVLTKEAKIKDRRSLKKGSSKSI